VQLLYPQGQAVTAFLKLHGRNRSIAGDWLPSAQQAFHGVAEVTQRIEASPCAPTLEGMNFALQVLHQFLSQPAGRARC
jgi:hypothetical protein